MIFEGNGQVYIPSKSRFIRFNGGLYSTVDPVEIEVLKKKYHVIDEPILDAIADLMIDSNDDTPDEVKHKRGRKSKNA